jgi:hypothetical protein
MSLSACVAEITKELSELRRDVSELQRENKELKDILTHSHHQWWKCSRPTTEELVDDLIHNSNQPEHLKWR